MVLSRLVSTQHSVMARVDEIDVCGLFFIVSVCGNMSMSIGCFFRNRR